jgi:hypothetical protein
MLRLVHGQDHTVQYILVSRLDSHQSQTLLVGRGNSVAFSQPAPEAKVSVSDWRYRKVCHRALVLRLKLGNAGVD